MQLLTQVSTISIQCKLHFYMFDYFVKFSF